MGRHQVAYQVGLSTLTVSATASTIQMMAIPADPPTAAFGVTMLVTEPATAQHQSRKPELPC